MDYKLSANVGGAMVKTVEVFECSGPMEHTVHNREKQSDNPNGLTAYFILIIHIMTSVVS